MRLVLYILISIILFTSCKSSFTKRHYRPGVFREHIKDVNSISLRKQTRNYNAPVSSLKNNISSNFNLSNSDSLNTNEFIKESSLFDKQKKRIKSNSNLKVSKFKKERPHRLRNFNTFFGDNNNDNLTKALKLLLILFLIFLVILIPLGYFILYTNASTNILLALLFLLLSGIGAVITLFLVILSVLLLIRFLIKRRAAKKLEPKKQFNSKDRFGYFLKWLIVFNLISIPLMTLGLLLAPNWQYLLQIISLSCFFVGSLCFFVALIFALLTFKWYKKAKNSLDEKDKRKFRLNFWVVMGPFFLLCLVLLLFLIFSF